MRYTESEIAARAEDLDNEMAEAFAIFMTYVEKEQSILVEASHKATEARRVADEAHERYMKAYFDREALRNG